MNKTPGINFGIPNVATATKPLLATRNFSGFIHAHDSYNCLSAASDGQIYYALSSDKIDVPGRVYRWSPMTKASEFLGDLSEICGEADAKTIVQGKSHVPFLESNGRLYFATHVGFYETIEGMERLPKNPKGGYGLYPGGHILSFDLQSGKFENLVRITRGEGVLAMTIDKASGFLYGISWPSGIFFQFDLNKNLLREMDCVSSAGEAGVPGNDYRPLCRALVVDPRDSAVCFSTSEGDIFTFSPNDKQARKFEGANLRLDYFGKYNPTLPGSMGYNWRQIFWHDEENVAYGVHGNAGYLFRFDPPSGKLELLERLTSDPSRRSGMYDQFSYGYLGFGLGPDAQTIYYLTGGPIYKNGRRLAGSKEIAKGGSRGIENLHLITYHIPSGLRLDHGPIFYDDGSRPSYVNSIAISHEYIYALARFEHEGKTVQDLISIPNPLGNSTPQNNQ